MNKITRFIIPIIVLGLFSCNQNSSTEESSTKQSSQILDSPFESQINDLIAKMTIEEKVGQMTQLTLGFLTSSTDQHDGKVKEIDEVYSSSLKAEEITNYLAIQKAKAFENELNENEIIITSDIKH